MPQNRSFFVSVDGIDGVGKSTQILELKRHLSERGCSVEQVRDPGSSEIGTRLRELLLESELTMHRRTEAMLFMASRCELVESTIRPALAAGRCVLSDRFLLSTVVYQSIEDETVDCGVPTDLLWQLGNLANGGVQPDLTILLDMPAARALERLQDREQDRLESRGEAYLERVRQTYLSELPRSSKHTLAVDATQSIESVSAEIRAYVTHWIAAE